MFFFSKTPNFRNNLRKVFVRILSKFLPQPTANDLSYLLCHTEQWGNFVYPTPLIQNFFNPHCNLLEMVKTEIFRTGLNW